MYRPRRIVDYSIVPLFLSTSRFIPADRTRARVGTYVCSASINSAVHFPPASNRILAGCFLDGVRFRVRYAIRIFLSSPSRHFIRFSTILLSLLHLFTTFMLYTNRLLWCLAKEENTLSLHISKLQPLNMRIEKIYNWIIQSPYILEHLIMIRMSKFFKLIASFYDFYDFSGIFYVHSRNTGITGNFVWRPCLKRDFSCVNFFFFFFADACFRKKPVQRTERSTGHTMTE